MAIAITACGSSGPPAGDQIELGEHLRQNATKVPVFSVIAGP